MKKITTLLILTLTLLTNRAFSQILFKNNYSKPVFAALAWYQDTPEYKGWVSSGWYKVIPGERKEILTYKPLNGYIYYYAKEFDSDLEFTGNNAFIIHPTEAFRIKNANQQYVIDENSQYVWKRFREVKIDGSLLSAFKFSYTIDFSY